MSSTSAQKEIVVTYEDQQKINRFARLNARTEEIKDELKGKKLALQNMDDALNEVSAAELEDDSGEGVRIQEGEAFVQFDFESATSWVEGKKKVLEEEVATANSTIESIREEMNQLKTALYAKFGKENINLEAEDTSS